MLVCIIMDILKVLDKINDIAYPVKVPEGEKFVMIPYELSQEIC